MTLEIEEVASSIPIKNIWYLLLYAWDMAAWEHATRTEWESAPNLLGLLARVLAFSTRQLMKRQLGRSFTTRKSVIRGIRGRVDFGASIKKLAFEKACTVCRFPELSIDTLKNQIIKGTLGRLIGDSRIDIADKKDETIRLRQELRRLVQAMDGVTLKSVSSHDFSQLQLGQNDRAYRIPLAVCALIHHLGMPMEQSGDTALVQLLKDEITFHMLFERFVRNFYRMHLTGFVVSREWLSWHDEFGCSLVPTMKTDISITQSSAPYRRIVADTKYSVRTLSDNLGSNKFKAEDLYQIYAYLRTQEHMSDAHMTADGVLIYPTTTYHIDSSMKVQGHRIRVVTLNLNDEWTAISKQLLATIRQWE